MDRLKAVLAIGSILLLGVIVFLISNLNGKAPSQKLFPINVFKKQKQEKPLTKPPTPLRKPNLTPSPITSVEKSFTFPKTLDTKSTQKIQEVIDTLPLETESYQASFSATIGKVIVFEKRPGGKNDFQETLANLGLPQNQIKNLIISTSSPEDLEKYREAEEIVKNLHIEETIKIRPTPTPYKFKTVKEYKKEQEFRASKSLENTIRKIFTILSTPAEYFEPQEETPPSPLPAAEKPIPPSLRGIVMEVSQRVGVPEGVLMGVLSIENPAVFYLPEIKVREYSKAGAVWPECRPNICSAAGPMQITTGVDSFGSSSCSQCCWKGSCLDTRGGCPNQWAIYGQAVNLYGGYNREPNPCNILDNIYAGALKLKTDSKASNPLVWTKEEVFRAARAYYGDCSVKYSRLGNRTYCEYVWDYYQSYGR